MLYIITSTVPFDHGQWRRCKMMRSSVDAVQLFGHLVRVVRALIRHPIRDDPGNGEPLLHGGDNVVGASTVVPGQLAEAAGIIHTMTWM
jgi:hypothetical protein